MTEIDQTPPPAPPAPEPAPADQSQDIGGAAAYVRALTVPPAPPAPAPASDTDVNRGTSPDEGGAESYVGQLASARKSLLAVARANGMEQGADRQAKVVALADRLQLPPSVVEANYDELNRKDTLQGVDNEALLKNHPELARWLVEPGNAGLTQAQLPQLQQLDRMAQGLAGVANPGDVLPAGFMYSERGDGTIRGPLHEDGSPPVVYRDLNDLRQQMTSQDQEAKLVQAQLHEHLLASSEQGGLPPALESGVQSSIGQTTAAVLSASNWWSRLFGGQGHATVGGLTSQELRQFASEGIQASELEDASLSGGMSRTAGSLIGDAPLYLAGGGVLRAAEAAPRLVDLGAKLDALAGLSQAPMSGLRDLGPILRALRATSPLPAVPNSTYLASVWKNALAFSPLAARSGINTGDEQGALYGSLDFLINAIGPGAAGRLGLATATQGAESAAASGGLPAVLGSFVTHATAQGGAQAVTELANAFHEYATGADPDALRTDKLLPRLAQAGAMGGLLTAAFQLPGAMGELTMRRQMAANAIMRETDSDASLVEAYKSATALSGGNEARGKDLLERLIPATARVRYMQAEDLGEVAKQVGMSPEELAGALNATDEYKQALATGKVMHIQTEDLAIAAAKLDDPAKVTALLSYRRSRPDGMNMQEGLQFFKDSPQEIAGLHSQMAADIKVASQSVTEADPIYRDMMNQVEEAGQPSQEARDDARLMAARFNTLATRWNEGAEARGARKLDPLEEYQKFKLQIQKAVPGAQVQDVTDALLNRIRDGNRPTAEQAFGPSLGQFLEKRGIRDVPGPYHDPEGHPLDVMAQRAYEHGYTDAPTAEALQAGMERETKGERVYAPAKRNEDLAKVHDILAGIEKTIAEKGAHIGMSNAAIKAKTAGAEGPAVGRYEQLMHGPPLEVDGKSVIAADVPYGGGSSKDGSKIYIDRRIPRYAKIDGKTVDLWQLIAHHEILEKTRLDQGKTYAESHREATTGEDHIADHQGIKHADYENFLKPFLATAKREAPKGSVPDDLEDRPYHEMGEANLLAGKSVRYEQAIGRIAPRGESLEFQDLLKQYRKANGDRTPVEGSKEWMQLQREARAVDEERGVTYAQGEARGSMEVNAARHFLISLGGKADLSTVLHESAHFWFETMGDYAMDPQAPPQLREDYQKLLAFSEYGTHEQKQSMQAEQAALTEKLRLEDRAPTAAESKRMAELVAPHEKVARAMEQYLMEGKAPSPELRGTFQRFRLWLTDIYRQIKNLVTLTPEVRGVFDRMLATDDAITAAQKEIGQVSSMYTLARFKGNQEKYQAYLNSIADARNTADARVLRQAMSTLRKQRTKTWNREKDSLRTEAMPIINAKPQYVAERALAHGLDKDGEPLEHAPKLDRKQLVNDYGPGVRGKLLRGITSDEPGAWSLEFAAQQFGFRSGGELYEAMLRSNFVPREQATEHLAEQFMQGRHPELSPNAMHEAAMQAVHANSGQADVLSRESAALALWANRTPMSREEFQGIARGMVMDQNYREVNHDSYVRAEKQFHNAVADELAKAEPDYSLALHLNQRAELAHACYRAAMEAEETIAETADLMRDGTKPKIQGMLGRAGGFVITGADGVPFITTEPGAAAQVMKDTKGASASFQDHYAQLTDLWGDKAKRLELTMGAVHDLGTEAKSIMTLAKEADSIQRAGEKEALSEAVADLTDVQGEAAGFYVIGENGERLPAKGAADAKRIARETFGTVKGNIIGVPRTKGSLHLTMQYLRQFEAGNRTIANICRALDDEKAGGEHWQLINRPLNHAANDETVRKLANMKETKDAFTAWGKRGVRASVFVKEVNESLDLETRIGVALYAGSAEGLERVMTGDQWSHDQVKAIVRTLDKSDLQLVKTIWSNMEKKWPEISALHRKLYGIAPEKAVHIPVETAFGTIKEGGYYPIMYDRDVGPRSFERSLQQRVASDRPGIMGSPRAGFTVKRQDTTGMRLQYGFQALFRHNDDTAHWLSHEEVGQNVTKILMNKEFAQSVVSRFGRPTYDALAERVNNVLEGPRGPQNALERGMRFVRTRTGLATMGYNLMTFVAHGFGIPQSMYRVGAADYLAAAGQLYSSAGDAVNGMAFVKAKSSMMANMRSIMTPESAERIRQGAAGNAVATIQDHALDLIHYALDHINSAAWLAEYKNRMAENPKDEQLAIDLADQAVRDTQGTGQTVDKTMWQDKNELTKMLSQYLSFFTRTYNLMRPNVANLHPIQDPQSMANLGKAFAMLVMLPATTEALFRQAMRPSPEENKDATWWLKKLGTANAEYALSSVFLGRELAGAFEGHGAQDPATMRSMTSLVGAAKSFEHFLTNPDLSGSGKVLRTGANLAMTYFGLPAGQIDRVVQGMLYDVDQGTFDPRAPLFGPPPRR